MNYSGSLLSGNKVLSCCKVASIVENMFFIFLDIPQIWYMVVLP